MLDRWVAPSSVVLCCEVPETARVRIPNMLDAYDQPVFRPVGCRDSRSHGVTLDLCADPLREGVDEFAVGSLPVTLVRLRPVRVDNAPNPVDLDESLAKRLLAYYATMT